LTIRIALTLFLSFIFVFAGSKELVLKQKYFCDDDTVYAKDFFPELEKDFVIAELKNRNRIQLSSRKIKKLFSDNGIEIKLSHPVVSVIKQSSYDKKILIANIKSLFEKAHKDIEIKSVKIRAKSFFEQDNLEFKEIEIPQQNLSRKSGTFSALYIDRKQNLKKVYFGYEIIAQIEVLKAKHNISNGTILNSINSHAQLIDFDDMRVAPVEKTALGSVQARSYIQEGSVITESMVTDIPDVIKGEEVSVFYKENGVNITIYAKALHDAKIGEQLKVKTNSGKSYNTRVVAKKRAVIE